MKTKESLLFLALILLSILFLIGGARYWAKSKDLELQVRDMSVQLAHSKRHHPRFGACREAAGGRGR